MVNIHVERTFGLNGLTHSHLRMLEMVLTDYTDSHKYDTVPVEVRELREAVKVTLERVKKEDS